MSSEDKNSIQVKQANIEQASSISTFIIKIYNLLNQPQNAQGICWHEDGKSFIIKNPTILTNYILPRYFRHNNYQSFIRQLNMYNFAKQKDYVSHRFAHKYFIRDREEFLRFIKRKPQKKKRKNSDESLESQKQNGSKSQIVSIKQIEIQEKYSQKIIQINSTKAEEPLVGFVNVKKKVGFNQAIQQKSQQNISTIMEATSKWINSKDQSCWVNIKSFKSIDLSMRLIENQEEMDEEKEISQNFPLKGQRHVQNSIILLFNPNISENNIRQLQN